MYCSLIASSPASSVSPHSPSFSASAMRSLTAIANLASCSKASSSQASSSSASSALRMRLSSSSSFLGSSARLQSALSADHPRLKQVPFPSGLPPPSPPLSSSSSSASSVRVMAMTSSYDSSSRPSRRNYRREPRPSVSELDLEEEVARIDMDPAKMMQPTDPNALKAVIKEVMPVGYFVDLPTGRVGYLPAQDLGFSGGLAVLQRLFKEGQEIYVRIVCRGGAGREIISCKKPEFAPPSEQKTIESMRLHFENEKKNQGRPRRR